ncbi:MAG: hypothetical protein Q8P20_00655 [bacterium]|nr:hypothetical protein [bacterium]
MDRDTAISICLDRMDVWIARTKDLINGSSNPERIEKLAANDDNSSVVAKSAKVLSPPARGPAPPIINLNLETASRDELVNQCVALGYSKAECKGKRAQTMIFMAKEKLKTLPGASEPEA